MSSPLEPALLNEVARLVRDGADMIGLAEALAGAKARSPREAKRLIAASGLSAAKVYALMAIGRALPQLGGDRARLNRIGWAKLRAILPKLGTMPIEALLDLAESVSAQSLPAVLKGRAPPPGAKRIAFLLAPEDGQRFIALLEACGAHQTRMGLRRKEMALMRLVDAACRHVPPIHRQGDDR